MARKRKLKVKRAFEPGRLSRANLEEAYARLVPGNIRIIQRMPGQQKVVDEASQQKLEGIPA
jgi:hypothetical protein